MHGCIIQSFLDSIQALLANFPREILQQGQVRSNAPGQTYLVRRGLEYQHRARASGSAAPRRPCEYT